MTDEIETQDTAEDWAGFSSASSVEDRSLHPATLVNITRKILPSKFDPSGKSPAIIWTFALDDLDGFQVEGTSSDNPGPGTKALRWIEALTGKPGGTAARAELIGREAQVLIKYNAKGYPKVDDVLSAKGAQKPQAAPDTAPLPPEPPQAVTDAPDGPCTSFSGEFGKCTRDDGHVGLHRNKDGMTWAA